MDIDVILLNGTTSSGKTSIAHRLQELLDEPHLYVPIDVFQGMLPRRWLLHGERAAEGYEWRDVPEQDGGGVRLNIGPAGERVAAGALAAMVALVRAGNKVIADYPLLRPSWLRAVVEAFEGIETLFVGVRCPLELAEERERVRGDRVVGLARTQYDVLHRHGLYDLELDTSCAGIDECAAQILARLRSGARPDALRRHRARLSPRAG